MGGSYINSDMDRKIADKFKHVCEVSVFVVKDM